MNKHIGSKFDDFLTEDGLLGEVEAIAFKRVLANLLETYMADHRLNKTSMAQHINTSRSELDRLLDPDNISITLKSIGRVTAIVGKKLKIAS